MSNPDHLAKLLQGTEAWNAWRAANPAIVPDLTGAKLTERAGLSRRTLSGGLNLSGALLQGADLSGACLADADLAAASLCHADVRNADLSRTNLVLADFSCANLSNTDFRDANVNGTNFQHALLHGAELVAAIGLMPDQIATADHGENTSFPFDLDSRSGFVGGNEEFDPFPFEEREFSADPFVALGVSEDANIDEIRTAYRSLAKKYHPDVNPEDPKAERRFANLNQAYQTALAVKDMAARSSGGSGTARWGMMAAMFIAALALPSGALFWLHGSGSSGVLWENADTLITHSTKPSLTGEPQQSVQRADAGHDEILNITTAPPREAISGSKNREETLSRATGTALERPPGPSSKDNRNEPVIIITAPATEPADDMSDRPDAAKPADQTSTQRLAALTEPAPARQESAEPAWDREWRSLRKTGDLIALHEFIARYPDKAAAEEARKRFRLVLAATDNSSALKQITGKFRAATPETSLANRRLARLMDLENTREDLAAWEAAREKASIAGYRFYLMNYPGGRYAANADQRLAALLEDVARRSRDDDDWASARARGTRKALEAYRQAHPDGQYRDLAAERLAAIDAEVIADIKLDERAWASARQKNSPDAYRTYLKIHPDGRHAAEAREAMRADEIRAAAIPERSASADVAPPERSATQSAPGAQTARPLRRALRFPSSDEPFVEPLSRRD